MKIGGMEKLECWVRRKFFCGFSQLRGKVRLDPEREESSHGLEGFEVVEVAPVRFAKEKERGEGEHEHSNAYSKRAMEHA